ncbi:MAG: dihydrofolate reductase [Bacteroidaceae bacterium]|nr:dihydrofolate reductase [Bacteroidaceae bacterium]
MITIIAAIAENNAIGLNGKLLYWLPADLKRFKALTTGHTIIMGRKTFESLPKGALPNRRNIVLTRSKKDFPGAETFPSLAAALAACNLPLKGNRPLTAERLGSASDGGQNGGSEEVYIIGGASVYAEALPLADRLCLTEVHDTPQEADAFFPDFNRKEWNVAFREEHEPDEKHNQSFEFVDYVRKSKNHNTK